MGLAPIRLICAREATFNLLQCCTCQVLFYTLFHRGCSQLDLDQCHTALLDYTGGDCPAATAAALKYIARSDTGKTYEENDHFAPFVA
jgi:hypothetical protein